MKKSPFLLLVMVCVNLLAIHTVKAQSDDFKFVVEKSAINKKLWSQPYRFEDKTLRVLSVEIITTPVDSKNRELNFDLFSLYDETNMLRIRPNAVFYYKGDKKVYLKSKAVNANYNHFIETTIKNYTNFEAKIYKPNFLGRKKKDSKSSVKSLKKITLKGKAVTYYVDFPIRENFSYGKVHYNDAPIGFAAAKN